MIDIFVGPEQKRFSVFGKLLYVSSDYFKKAMNGAWREAKERKFYLDDDPESFQIYCTWLYTKVPAIGKETCDASESQLDVVNEYDMIGRAYVLGEKRQDAAFRNALITAIFERHEIRTWDGFRVSSDSHTIRRLYANTGPNAKIRSLLVDMGVEYANGGFTIDDLPYDFLVEFSRKMLNPRSAPQGGLKEVDCYVSTEASETERIR